MRLCHKDRTHLRHLFRAPKDWYVHYSAICAHEAYLDALEAHFELEEALPAISEETLKALAGQIEQEVHTIVRLDEELDATLEDTMYTSNPLNETRQRQSARTSQCSSVFRSPSSNPHTMRREKKKFWRWLSN